ncbi:MAG: SDR family oxidoreductase, partial [Lachnospiraceae bacterium]|nr:SDR family oxidoreductase [Lachnospiraceae bacterium]
SVRTEFFDDRHSGYSITKTGTEAVTRCFASEYGVFGITSNMLCLGMIKTPMTAHYWDDPEFVERLKKLAPVSETILPEDVSHIVMMLCADECRFINGEKIHVDGGSFLWKANV